MSEQPNVVFYEDIETAPHQRYFKFNNYLAMAAETGENWEDLMTRIQRANKYIASDDKESAFRENSNMLMAFSFIKNEFSPTGMAYAVQVKSINGVERNDITETGLLETLDELNKIGISFSDFKHETERIKKKSLMSYLYSLKKRFLD